MPKRGDRVHEVEWCVHLPRFGEECIPDMATYMVRRHTDEKEAIAFAKRVLPEDQFGCVAVRLMEFAVHDCEDAMWGTHGVWEQVGEPVHVSEGDS